MVIKNSLQKSEGSLKKMIPISTVPIVGINEMRRHYANYLKGLPNIKEYRNQLVTLKTEEEINSVLDEIEQTYSSFEFEKSPIELVNYHEKCPTE